MKKTKMSFSKALAYGFISICVLFDLILGFSHAETWTKIFGITCFSLVGLVVAIFMPEMHSEDKHAEYEMSKRRSRYEAIKAKRRLRDARLAPKIADRDRRSFVAFMLVYARKRKHTLQYVEQIRELFAGSGFDHLVYCYKRHIGALQTKRPVLGIDPVAIKRALDTYTRLVVLDSKYHKAGYQQ